MSLKTLSQENIVMLLTVSAELMKFKTSMLMTGSLEVPQANFTPALSVLRTKVRLLLSW